MRIRRHLEHGAPWAACDAFREAITRDAGDVELLYWGALAHARAGATKQAHAVLDQAQSRANEAPARLADILSLRGRLWKDGVHRAHESDAMHEMARRSRDEYLAAYAIAHDSYPGINAATLSMLIGDESEARQLAMAILDRLNAQPTPRTCWDHATAGEAELLLGRIGPARQSYVDAYALAPDDAGSVGSMRRQVRLLARVLPEAAAMLDVLPAPQVIAFAGHMIDRPGRRTPRFPAALEPAVNAALRERLSRMRHPIVYTSAACGADIVLIEAALDLGAEVNVLLPFNRDDFVRTSVAIGGDGWTKRFDDALARATRVIPATQESHLGDDVLFLHAAMLVEGLAALRAAQLETTPSLLCVLDAGAPGHIGGALGSFERWQRHFGQPHVIDLAALRASAGLDAAATTAHARLANPGDSAPPDRAPDSAVFPSGSAPGPTAADLEKRPRRTLRTMLFADFAGYSKLHDAYAPLFQGRFWQIAADQIDASPIKPLLANTWGDALYAVFDSPREAAVFALGFLTRMRAVDWTATGLPESSQIRIALHSGPVFCGFDPIIGRDNFFGSSVTRAARIEPVTPPGMVYASEAFAATFAATGQDEFALEYIGEMSLAKGYGASRVYRLDRR